MYSIIAISFTKACNAECRICSLDCSPRESGTISRSIIEQARDYASKRPEINQIGLSGGEPFLYEEELFSTLSVLAGARKKLSVVSNGFWGVSVEAARGKLIRLLETGVSILNLSTDDFHEEFVGIDRIRTICEAAEGLPIQLAIGVVWDGSSSRLWKVIGKLKPHHKGITFFENRCANVGRAARLGHGTDPVGAPERIGPCESLNTIVIMPDGSVFPCCSHFAAEIPALRLGNLGEESLEDIMAREPPLVAFLRRAGPGRLSELGYSLPEGGSRASSGMCELCARYLTAGRAGA